MTVRILELGERNKKKAAKIAAHAKKKKNWYRPKSDSVIPGHDPRHQCKLSGYRCVFSYTVSPQEGKVYRHLSISVPTKGKMPHPVAVREIAKMFGFTEDSEETPAGFPSSWGIDLHQDHPTDDDCVILLQDTGLRP